MGMQVKGKTALITGGAQGLGKGFSRILLQNGAKVLFTDINEETGQATEKEFQNEFGQDSVVFVKADVTSEAQMEEAFKLVKSKFGHVHIVVNNAGLGLECLDCWELGVDVNLKGPIRCSGLALNYMRQDKGGEGGVIVNIGSAAGFVPVPQLPIYAATKAGLILYTRSLAADADIVANGVKVNALCPADVRTQPNARFRERFNMPQDIPMLTVDTVAEGLLELVTDESKNGEVMTMSAEGGKKYVNFASLL